MTLSRRAGVRSTPIGPPHAWALDWSWIGFVTAAGVPFVALRLFNHALLDHYPLFVPLCGMLGLGSGALVGMVLRALASRTRSSSYRAVAFLGMPVVLGSWGAAVASAAHWLSGAPWVGSTDGIVLSWALGTMAATLQVAWLAPTYPWWAAEPARRNAWRFGVLPMVTVLLGAITPFASLPLLSAMGY